MHVTTYLAYFKYSSNFQFQTTRLIGFDYTIITNILPELYF